MKVSNTIGFSLIETLKSSVLYRDDALTESFTCPTDKKALTYRHFEFIL